jgi:DNA-directed RNA polymerase subunit L
MEIKVLESEKTKLRIELVGKTNTMANILVKALWNDSDVDVAGYNVMHPQTSNAIVVLETKKKDAKKVLLDAIASVKKDSKDLVVQFCKIAK